MWLALQLHQCTLTVAGLLWGDCARLTRSLDRKGLAPGCEGGLPHCHALGRGSHQRSWWKQGTACLRDIKKQQLGLLAT